jgi:aminoglycoside phosphotransferase (APT) family kinase protein
VTTGNNESAGVDLDQARAMAHQLITHHFGDKLTQISPQPGGLSNFVFLVKHTEGDFIVRISPDPPKLNAFIKEQWAMRKARDVGVPTAEVLEVGNDVAPLPYMISRKVVGQEATFHPSRMQIIHELGRYTALINSIPTSGFGGTFDWSSNQLSRNETWQEFLDKELQVQARLELMEKHRILSPALVTKIRSTLGGVGGVSLRPALNHGDIRLKNVIVDGDGLITAIIDWEHCMSNIAPAWELSLALHDLAVDEKEEFLKGYGLSESDIADLAPVMKALNLINYAPEIERALDSDNTAQLERYRTRLSGALDLYSF